MINVRGTIRGRGEKVDIPLGPLIDMVFLLLIFFADAYFEGKRIDIRSVRAHIERALAEDPESGVVIVADKRSQTGAIVTVMDQCRLAGAKTVSLAAKREDEES